MKAFVIACVVLCTLHSTYAAVIEQIHLALTQDMSERTVSFVTQMQLNQSTSVSFGTSPSTLSKTSPCSQRAFVDGGSAHRTIYLHECLMSPLSYDTRYYYQIGNANAQSAVLNFTTWKETDPEISMAVYGDFGLINSRSMQPLLKNLTGGTYDMVLHVGDLAYNLDTDDGTVGDQFMNMVQPIMQAVPYMTCAGNHETAYNFSHYTERFAAISQHSNTGNNWWFSFDVSYVHFVALTSEIYYNEYLYPKIMDQYKFLLQDLQSVNRTKTPFVVVYLHRPLYCSNVDDVPDCTTDAQKIRQGFNSSGVSFPGLDDVLTKYHANIVFTAHEHSYERTWPVYKGEVDPTQTDPNVMTNPQYPTHIVAGAAGCQEDLDYFAPVLHGKWSLYRAAAYGFGLFRIVNSTHLYWEQFIAEGVRGVDSMWYVQTKLPNEPRADIELSHAAHPECHAYCAAVCMHRENNAKLCAEECRCTNEHRDLTFHTVAKAAQVRVKRSLVHGH
eukprot:m.91691 g.91691  ORF g.91691 m.91691 type:complete len:499 (-) comp12957_c0_seq3:2036-3532(-)